MNLLADESVDGPIVRRLRRDRHKVLYVAEMTQGISDDKVLAEANRIKAVLITADKDFGELVFRRKRLFSGVILIRLAGQSRKIKSSIVSKVLKDHADEMAQAFTVISRSSIRIRPKT